MFANRFVLAAIALVGFTSLASAEHIRGVVVKIDGATGQLTIEARGVGVRGTVLTFTLDKDAQVLLGNQPAALKDVAVGKRVQVTYESKDGKRVAAMVHVNNLLGAVVPTDTRQAAPAKDPSALTGKLRRVAYTDREIVLATPGQGDKESYISLPVASDAKITRDDKAIKFDDLKEEETAVVRTETRDGKKVATAVQVGKVTMDKPNDASKVSRIREILKIVDALLEQVDNRSK
jgi:hypothetical protein